MSLLDAMDDAEFDKGTVSETGYNQTSDETYNVRSKMFCIQFTKLIFIKLLKIGHKTDLKEGRLFPTWDFLKWFIN